MRREEKTKGNENGREMKQQGIDTREKIKRKAIREDEGEWKNINTERRESERQKEQKTLRKKAEIKGKGNMGKV